MPEDNIDHPPAQAELPVATLTAAALARVRFLRTKQGDVALCVRLAVKGGGCSGLSYVMTLERDARPGDLIAQFDDVVVHVDPRSAEYVHGTTVDFSIKNLLEGGWVFNNPNAQRSCGCGTSFTPRAKDALK